MHRLADNSLTMSNTFEMTPAERRREKQRQHIIKQATVLYFENGGEDGGFENTTVEAIAERSDISLRTFFRYFESKLDVIYLDSARAVVDLEAFVRHRLETEPPAIAALNGRMDQIRFFSSDPISRQRLERALKAPQFRDRLNILRGNSEMLIARLITPHFDGPLVARREKALLTATLTSAITALISNPAKLGSDVDLDAEARNALAVFQGLLTEATAHLTDS